MRAFAELPPRVEMRVAPASSSPAPHEPRCDPDRLQRMKYLLRTFGIEAARQAAQQAAQMMAVRGA